MTPASFIWSLQDNGQIQFNISGRLFVCTEMLGIPPYYHTTSYNLHLAKYGGACTVFSAIKCMIHKGAGLWRPRCCRLHHLSTAINSLLLLQKNCGSGLCSIFTLILYASVLTLFYILLPSSCSSVSAIFRYLPLSG